MLNILSVIIVLGISFAIPYLILKRYTMINDFDKIIVISFVNEILFLIPYWLNKEENFKILAELVEAKVIDSEVYSFIISNYIYLLYTWVMFFSFFFYYLLERKSFFYWKLSYLWIIPYLILFFMRFYYPTSLIIKNVMEILKVIYALYFLQLVTKFVDKYVQKQTLSLIVAVFTVSLYPELSFVAGTILRLLKKD